MADVLLEQKTVQVLEKSQILTPRPRGAGDVSLSEPPTVLVGSGDGITQTAVVVTMTDMYWLVSSTSFAA